MTYSEAEILTGDQQELAEVHQKRDQMLDFSRCCPLLCLSDIYVG